MNTFTGDHAFQRIFIYSTRYQDSIGFGGSFFDPLKKNHTCGSLSHIVIRENYRKLRQHPYH